MSCVGIQFSDRELREYKYKKSCLETWMVLLQVGHLNLLLNTEEKHPQ